MKIVFLLHSEFEGAGYIPSWASERGHQVDERRLFKEDPLPQLGDFDVLVSMGGPMSANDPQPSIAAEIELMRAAYAAGKRILGVCLGAQLLARALGAAVSKNPSEEIGWYEVRKVPGSAGEWLPGDFMGDMTVLHWHGETFAIPEGASRLFESEACANQAFALGGRALGLQFHLEVDRPSLEKLIAASAPELDSGGPFVQDPDAIREGFALHAESCRRTLRWLLDSFLS